MQSICPKCEGTGWRPIESDGVRRVRRCECYSDDRSNRLMRAAHIPRRYEHCCFDNFSTTNGILERAEFLANHFTKEYPLDYGLLFVGPNGVGKTHLAVSVLRELSVAKGIECLFYDFHQLLDDIQKTYDSVSQSSKFSVLQPVHEVEVLLLDELSAVRATDWVRDTLAHIINSRYNEKKVTLVTTTLNLEAEKANKLASVSTPSGEKLPNFAKSLAQLGPTLCSRLHEMCQVVEMDGYDYRERIKRARSPSREVGRKARHIEH